MSNETGLKNLAAAYIKAQQEMAPLLKDTKGNFGKYATLASVQDVCIPAFSKYGIAVFQSVATHWEENRVYVRINCTLFHADSGECIVYEPLDLVPTKTDPQGIGSAITYGRRYSMMAIAGIAPEDDDGQLASGGKVEAPKTSNKQMNAPQPQAPAHRQPETSNGNGNGEKSKAFKAFMAEGTAVFAAEWDNARHWLIERYTKKTTPDNVRKSANDLTDTELTTLANTIKNHGSTFLADWAKQPKKEAA